MELPKKALAHWCKSDDFHISSNAFYKAVKEALGKREVPNITFSHVDWSEGGLLSANRRYLRVSRGRFNFDICAAPFGKGFFFSWWLTSKGPAFFKLFASALLWLFVVPAASFSVGVKYFHSPGAILGVAGLLGGLWAMFQLVSHGSENGVEDALLSLPILRQVYVMFFDPETFYKYDTEAVFRECVSTAFHEVLDEVRKQNGLRALFPLEKVPRLRDLPH